MNYQDLLNLPTLISIMDEVKVNMYIPAKKRFYKMTVCLTLEHGVFCISNYGCPAKDRIDGHETQFLIHNQVEMDAFFYIQTERVTLMSYKNGEKHYEKNGVDWIFNSDLMQKAELQ